MSTYVIAGVTGNTGAAAAHTLLSAGKKVRVIVRSAEKGEAWKAKGAEVFVGSLEDPIALAHALEGAAGAYLLVPPDPTHPAQLARARRLVETYVEALTRTHVPHVVFLSSVAAHLPSGTGPIVSTHYAEQRLPTVARTVFTFVRAAYFIENLGSSVGAARAQGIFPVLASPEPRFEQVATEDIGRVAAEALLDPPGHTQIIELSGPEPRSFGDAIEFVSKHLGKPLQTIQVPQDHIAGALTQAGLSTDLANLYAEMSGALGSGKIVFEGGHRTVRGRVTLETVLTRLAG